VFDNALVAAGLLDDPRSMLGRLNAILEDALASEGSTLFAQKASSLSLTSLSLSLFLFGLTGGTGPARRAQACFCFCFYLRCLSRITILLL
jgi:hypothetical protein